MRRVVSLVAVLAPSHYLGWVELLRARLAIAPRYVEAQKECVLRVTQAAWQLVSFLPATWFVFPYHIDRF